MTNVYIVKMKIDYYEVAFKFDFIEDATDFMLKAYQYREKKEDNLKITMEIREENTNEPISD